MLGGMFHVEVVAVPAVLAAAEAAAAAVALARPIVITLAWEVVIKGLVEVTRDG